MKKLALFVISIFITGLSFSQNSDNKGTTTDEYNYMTKGYEIQISSGLDPKSGYRLENIAEITRGSYTFNFNALVRSEKNELAGILIIAHSDVSGRTYYLGMPINNAELQEDFEDDIRSWDESMTTAYAKAVSELYALTINSCYTFSP
ncbi:MAG: hypothetical protein Kow0075_01440 [Salibacteraceae bacterium]